VSEQISNFFRTREYPEEIIQSVTEKINNIDRAVALQKSEPKSTYRIPLVLPFHPSIHPIRRIILRNYKALMNDTATKNIFPKVPITAYKRDHNLANHLVRAFHPKPSVSVEPGTFSCDRKRCNTCNFVTKDQNLCIVGPNGTYSVKDHFTCVSHNVVYAIICKKCKLIYIGETQRRLADRITEHINVFCSIRLNLRGGI